MAFEFKFPDVGEGVAEGEIVSWKVAVGDSVKEDDPLVEVMTDKATVEIPSPTTGTILEIRAKEGDVIPVGDVLVVIGEAGEGAPTRTAKKPAAAAGKEPVLAAAPLTGPTDGDGDGAGAPSGRIRATPAVRKLAREMSIDLGIVPGTGPRGRITKKDVELIARKGSAAAAPRSQARPKPKPLPRGEREQRIPLRGIRRKIAEHLAHAKRTAPHFTYVDEVDMTEVVALRKEAKSIAESRGVKITYLPFVIKSLVPALREYPLLNSSLDDASGEIVLKNYYNIGIAMSTEEGLIVPVIHDADQKGLLELASDIQNLSTKAREGKLTLPELQGGTFTITSTGNIGGLFATPIVNHPEVAILGIHKISPRPVVRDGQIVIRDMMNVSLSFDHRVVDGAVGAAFANRLIRYLSDPKLFLLESL
ncbi:MAG: dihydrolipoamide acetyltransferase family protein [Planctomycetota bacterium]|nr:dihydrolipoamide acetyltransferase family protein [Planctomycetota bacterium]